jgi:hypothetical protein
LPRPPSLSVALVLLLLGPGTALCQETAITRYLHPWGRFQEGAWKRYRDVTETLDERGVVTNLSVTETKTTLQKVEGDGVTLLVEAVVDIAGKQLSTQPRTVKQGFHGKQANQKSVLRDLGTNQLTIEGRVIPCRVEQVEVADNASKTVTKTYYSPTVAPFVLRRESIVSDLEGKTKLSETTLEVVALHVPCKILSRLRSAAHVKAVTSHPQGTTTTWAYTSIDVPGGVLCQTAEERDEKHRLVRKSTLELIDYGFTPEQEHPGLFNRVRGRHRAHRSAVR